MSYLFIIELTLLIHIARGYKCPPIETESGRMDFAPYHGSMHVFGTSARVVRTYELRGTISCSTESNHGFPPYSFTRYKEICMDDQTEPGLVSFIKDTINASCLSDTIYSEVSGQISSTGRFTQIFNIGRNQGKPLFVPASMVADIREMHFGNTKTFVLVDPDHELGDLSRLVCQTAFGESGPVLCGFQLYEEAKHFLLRHTKGISLVQMLNEDTSGRVISLDENKALVSFMKGRIYFVVSRIDSKQCSICLEEYRSGVDVSVSNCGHDFHSQCIEKWLLLDKIDCPLCRSRLSIIV